jgi:hypothetical protein
MDTKGVLQQIREHLAQGKSSHIANAVYDATGSRIRDLPIVPQLS